MKLVLTILFILCTFYTKAQSVSVVATPWNNTARHSFEAGLDYTTTEILSDAAQTKVNISTSISLLAAFRVFIHRDNTQWNSNLKLYARRTGTGTIGGVTISAIQNGTTFQEVTTSSAELFRYVDTLSLFTTIANIPIQYRVSGISVTIPVATYSTTVVYTIVSGL